MQGRLPAVRANVTLVPGFFEQTLPRFAQVELRGHLKQRTEVLRILMHTLDIARHHSYLQAPGGRACALYSFSQVSQ